MKMLLIASLFERVSGSDSLSLLLAGIFNAMTYYSAERLTKENPEAHAVVSEENSKSLCAHNVLVSIHLCRRHKSVFSQSLFFQLNIMTSF